MSALTICHACRRRRATTLIAALPSPTAPVATVAARCRGISATGARSNFRADLGERGVYIVEGAIAIDDRRTSQHARAAAARPPIEARDDTVDARGAPPDGERPIWWTSSRAMRR
jgi:hypothetical protein